MFRYLSMMVVLIWQERWDWLMDVIRPGRPRRSGEKTWHSGIDGFMHLIMLVIFELGIYWLTLCPATASSQASMYSDLLPGTATLPSPRSRSADGRPPPCGSADATLPPRLRATILQRLALSRQILQIYRHEFGVGGSPKLGNGPE
jgi:hypothetical protein